MATNYKYITNITEEELESKIIIPCVDEENFNCILIRNALEKTLRNGYSTDNLEVKLNRILSKGNSDHHYHIIRCKKTDDYSKKQFDTIYEYIFKKIYEPIDDVELAGLVISLEEYFTTSPEKDTRALQIGIFGELFTIMYLYEGGYKEIINKYHTNFYSKHDIEIDEKTRFEIKTTLSEKRIHHFKHTQIQRNDVDVFVCSVMLEESKEGLTLYDMFIKVKNIFIDPDSLFALDKLMKKCNLNRENKGLSFGYTYAFNKIRFYNAKALPKIDIDSIDGVTNIEYDIDCSFAETTSLSQLLKIFD